jgi:hypothetical protein
MNDCRFELSEIKPLLEYDSILKFQNSFLDYGIIILSQNNDKKLHESIATLDDLKESLINNPDNKVLKMKFQLILSQLKSIISTRKHLELLHHDIKKLKRR